ncbi:MAG: HDOD domain-containing protein [Planctomycetales bacterium]
MSSKHIAVILFNEEHRAGALAEALRSADIEVQTTASTDDFRRLLNKQRVDLVIVENDLDGFLSGLEVLERIYDDLLRPRTLLMGDMSREMQGRAAKVGVDRIVPDDVPPAELREEVERILRGGAGDEQANIPPRARSIVRNTPDLKPLPQLLTRLCNYLDHQTASMTALADDIAVDPKVTAELLKLANSTALGFRTKIKTVFDAVRLLGIRRTVGLVLSAHMVRSQAELSRALPQDVQGWYNSRSVLIGSTASAFARGLANVSADTAYVLGLLQDIGVLVLARHFGDRYLRLLDRVTKVAPLRLEICEMQEFDVHHAHVSAALLQKWELPRSLIAMVLAHHEVAPEAERADVEERFLHVMRIGEAVANVADNSAPQRYQALNSLLTRFGDQRGTIAQCLAEAVAKTVESSALLALPAPDAEAVARLLRGVDPAADAPLPSPATAPPPPAPSPVSQRDRKRILVVEDDLAVVRLIERMLEEFNVAVASAADADDARQHAVLADAVLCDVHLDGEGGPEFVRSLRQQRFSRPIIMISGDRSRSTVMECLESGADDYLVKPFDKATLVDRLRRRGIPIGAPVGPAAG